MSLDESLDSLGFDNQQLFNDKVCKKLANAFLTIVHVKRNLQRNL